MGADDRPAAHVVSGVRDDRQHKRRGRGRVDVLADLADPPLHLALDLAGQLSPALGVEPGLGELLQGAARHPLGVDRQELAAGQPQSELHDLAADPHVPLEHLGRQVPQGFLEDVLAGRASGRAARDHAFEPPQAGAGLFLDWLARRQRGAQPLDDRLSLGQPLAKLGRL